MKKWISCLLIVAALHSYAQYPRVVIPGSEVRKITSAVVTGQEYALHIMLPGGYAGSTKKYPVVYLMDSQWDFPLVNAIYGEQYYDGFIPGLIIVGVTWGGTKPNPDSLRARDYTPTAEARVPQSGGADKFLSFMKEELFPFIESNYRAEPGNRILMGCSLGGLFTMYTMFTHTDMFSGYIAASPAVGWDNEVLYSYEKKFAAQKINTPIRLYMTVGEVERSRPAFEKMAKMAADRKYTNVSLRSKVLENTGHSGTKAETYARGLQYIFERPQLKLDAAVLNRYVGRYETTGGNKVEIKNEEGNLSIYFSPADKFSLYAAGEADFYSTAEYLDIQFKNAEGKTEGFQLNRYGNSQFVKKIN